MQCGGFARFRRERRGRRRKETKCKLFSPSPSSGIQQQRTRDPWKRNCFTDLAWATVLFLKKIFSAQLKAHVCCCHPSCPFFFFPDNTLSTFDFFPLSISAPPPQSFSFRIEEEDTRATKTVLGSSWDTGMQLPRQQRQNRGSQLQKKKNI